MYLACSQQKLFLWTKTPENSVSTFKLYWKCWRNKHIAGCGQWHFLIGRGRCTEQTRAIWAAEALNITPALDKPTVLALIDHYISNEKTLGYTFSWFLDKKLSSCRKKTAAHWSLTTAWPKNQISIIPASVCVCVFMCSLSPKNRFLTRFSCCAANYLLNNHTDKLSRARNR